MTRVSGNMKKRLFYLVAFLALVAIEVLIALFVNDSFVRPYVGDVLVVLVIYCFVRIFVPNGVRLLPLYIFLFALAVEIGQYFDFVALLGLEKNQFFSTLLGRTFSLSDIVCYAVGCAISALCPLLFKYGKHI